MMNCCIVGRGKIEERMGGNDLIRSRAVDQ
jgi:hypothetical protein